MTKMLFQYLFGCDKVIICELCTPPDGIKSTLNILQVHVFKGIRKSHQFIYPQPKNIQAAHREDLV